MKRTKKLLSFFLAIVMVITAIPAFTIITDAATQVVNRTVSVSKYAVMASSSRNSGTTFTICNDGRTGNFSIGIVQFNISNIVGDNKIDTITSANYSLTYKTDSGNGRTNGMNLVFYYPTANLDTFTINSSPSTINSNSGTAYSTIFNSSSTYDGQHGQRAINHFGLQSMQTITTKNDGATKSASINITNMLNYFMGQNMSVATLMFLFPNCDSSQNGSPWTDTAVTISTGNVSVTGNETVYSTTVTAADNANSSTYRVVLDDAIYTYESESAYYNYGTNISTLDPWDTQVNFKSGSASDIAKITCLDSGATLTLNGTNKLQGDLKLAKYRVSSGATDLNATLLFTFTDGTKEYHRVAVKSYPVESHICSVAVRDTSSETGYTMFMRGSTGAGGTGVWKYYKSYYTSGTTAHGFPDGPGNSYTTGKMAMIYAYSYSDYWNNRDAVPAVGTATYYIDKSCKDTSWAGLGNSEYWYGSNYVIPIDIVRTKFAYGSGTDSSNFDINNMPVASSVVNQSSIDWTDRNGLTNRLTFTHNASVNASNRWTNAKDTTCNLRIALRRTDRGYALYKTNVIVNLFDKSTARKKYDDLIKLDLKENNYTASTFAAYQNALLNMEAYLSNYEDTSEASTSSTVYTDLVNAYNGLVPRTTEAQYQELLTLDQKLKTAKSYVSSAPIDRPYTNTSYNNFKGALITDPTGQAEQDLAAYQAGTKDLREFAQSTYTTYKNAYNSVLDILVERADFGYYDEQADAVAGNLTNYTAKDGQYIRLYSVLQPYKSITLYTNAQKIETPKTSQTTVNDAGQVIAEANTGVNNSTPVDQTALTSFTTEFANFDTDVYTESVVNAKLAEAAGLYKSITFNGTQYFGLDVANQADLDNKLTSYLNAINSSINTYNVTVPSSVTATASYAATPTDNGDNTKTYAYPLGTDVTFTNGNADTAWYMAVQSNNTTRGQQYQTYGKSFTTKVVGDLTITAESAVAATPYYVAIIREYDKAGTGKAIDRVNYVANNSTYTLPTPTKIANYNFAGYVVNGVTKAAGDVITITADTEIAAKYEYFGSELTVTVNGTEKKCVYNESVTVSAAGAYAWVEKTGTDTWRPFYIGSTVTFRATESTVLKSVTQDEFNAMFTAEAFAPILRQNGVLVDADNRAVFHAQRIDYLPAGAQVVEFGILMNTAYYKKGTPVYDFDLGNDKADGEKNQYTVRMKSTQSLDKVQFNIFAKNAGDKPFTYRSYMIYKLADGTVKTVYSDVETKV